MNEEVTTSKRRYCAPRRAAQAAATRHAVLVAARRLFDRHGYSATTITEIAEVAGVAVDTVYATVGRKPVLLRELVQTALSDTSSAVPTWQREIKWNIRSAIRAEEKIVLYANAIASIHQRLGSVFLVLRDAAATDSSCARLRDELGQRRRASMREFVADLRGTGQVRDDLTDAEVADILWSMNAAEYWALLVGERSWTIERFQSYLADAWMRLLLR